MWSVYSPASRSGQQSAPPLGISSLGSLLASRAVTGSVITPVDIVEAPRYDGRRRAQHADTVHPGRVSADSRRGRHAETRRPMPGRPEGFHLQPATEPCVNLSIYTARPSHFLPPRDDNRRGRRVLLPISRLTSTFLELGHPLRSTPITGASSLLPDDPPPPYTSVVSPFVFRTYRVFLWHCMKSSQVPYPNPDQSHATYTPDTTWPISRHPPC